MEMIKCSKCGCEMSAMSEACPLCGTPVHECDITLTPQANTSSVVNDSESVRLIEPFTINELSHTAKTLSDAIAMAVGHVKSHPLEWVGLNPSINNSEAFKQAFDLSNILVGYGSISNRPIVSSELDYETSEFDGRQILTLEDCRQYASDFAKLFAKKGISDIDRGYEFTTMAVLNIDLQNYSEEVTVKLYLNPKCEDLSKDIAEFNKMASPEYGQLALDTQNNILHGTIKTIPMTGGIFEKRKRRKSNNERFQALHNLVLKTYPFLDN